MGTASDAGLVRVWDPMMRIGHWVLVAAFATAYLTEGEPQWLHTFASYAIAATVAVRIVPNARPTPWRLRGALRHGHVRANSTVC